MTPWQTEVAKLILTFATCRSVILMRGIQVGSAPRADFGSYTSSPFAVRLRYLGLKASPFVGEGGRE